jgi:hypothetical protein
MWDNLKMGKDKVREVCFTMEELNLPHGIMISLFL